MIFTMSSQRSFQLSYVPAPISSVSTDAQCSRLGQAIRVDRHLSRSGWRKSGGLILSLTLCE